MCCSKACVSTPDGRGHSWLSSAVGKVYREFVVDHGTYHVFLYTFTQIFCRPSTSLCDHSMRAAENQKAPIPCVRKVRQKVLASAFNFWLDRVPVSLFHGISFFWRSCHHFPCPSNLCTSTCHWCIEFWDVRHLSSDSVRRAFPSLPILVDYEKSSV